VGVLPGAVVAQIGDAVWEEFALALRTQARPLREARQGPGSLLDDGNNGPSPECFSARGG
jgi:hypothetical protein